MEIIGLMNVLSLALVNLTEAQAKYNVRYNDCTRPANIISYAATTACNQPVEPPSKPEKWTIVTTPRVTTVEGYSCQVTHTLHTAQCGVWGHLKVGGMPRFNRPYPLQISECNHMVKQRAWAAPGAKTTTTLQMDEPTYISTMPVGQHGIGRDGVMRCQGQWTKVDVDGRAVGAKDVVKMAEYRVFLRKETYLIEDGQVDVETERLRLPCSVSSLGCQTTSATYVWDAPDTKCNLQVVRTMDAELVDGTYLVDASQQLIFNTTGERALPTCNTVKKLVRTDYPDIYLLKGTPPAGLPYLDARNVEIETNMQVAMAYLAYVLEDEIAELRSKVAVSACQLVRDVSEGQITRLDGNRFAKLSGELLYTFQCKEKVAEIIPAAKCHDDIPIGDGLFVTPVTRMLVKHSPVRACDPMFPLVVEITHHVFVEISTIVRPRAARKKPPTRPV